MGNLNLHYGLHNKQLKLYARNTETKVKKAKILKFFLGDSFEVKTDITFWNNKEQKFHTVFKKVPVPTANEDNEKLEELKERLQNLVDSLKCETPDQLFDAYATAMNVVAAKPVTLLEYAIIYRDMWKEGKHPSQKSKSGNYVVYDKLINKLQGKWKGKIQDWKEEAERFAKLPIASITSKDYVNWANFIKKHKLGQRDSLNTFRSTVYYYQHTILENLKFSMELPKNLTPVKETNNVNTTLSQQEENELIHFDIESILPNTKDKQLMKDACLLMLGTFSRPCDVISMRIEDIEYNKEINSYTWNYCPQKMINRSQASKIPLKKELANNIIEKYAKGRKTGFLLPFTCNQDKDREWIERKAAVNHVTVRIGKFLQAIAKKQNWKIQKPTMYTLRKTGITSLCEKAPSELVAVIAKTSTREIDRVYRDRERIALNMAGIL